jgi:hypothetical protein
MGFGKCFQLLRNIVMHVAALLTFLIFITDILYAIKAPFADDYMKSVVGLLGLRFGLLILVQFWWIFHNSSVSNFNQNSSNY